MISFNLRFTIGDLRGALGGLGSQAVSRFSHPRGQGEKVAMRAHSRMERRSSIVNPKS